jgi:hypothetical protein
MTMPHLRNTMEVSSTQDATGCVAIRQFDGNFMKPEGSLQHSQELSTCLYSEPDQSSHITPSYLQDPSLPSNARLLKLS